MYRSIRLLTATVNPGGMSYTVLQDPEERKNQYIEAINYYLHETDIPVVFVENTGCDFSYLFKSYINDNRLEYLTFKGNTYDKLKGKGYGEANMIIYAINNSKYVRNAKYITKITGRLIVYNIQSIVTSPALYFGNVFRTNIEDLSFVSTTVLSTSPYILKTLLERHKEEITEEDRGNNWIENVLARSIVSDKDVRLVLFPFIKPPLFDSFSGTSNSKYYIKNSYLNATDNMALGAKLCKLRGATLNAIFLKIFFYCFIVYYKVVRK